MRSLVDEGQRSNQRHIEVTKRNWVRDFPLKRLMYDSYSI